MFRSLALLHGVTGQDVRRLSQELQARYIAATRLQEADQGRLVFEIDHERLPEPMFGALLAFQATFGPVWMHFAAGKLWMRAQTVDCSPEDCIGKLAQALAMAEIKAHVQVVELGERALGPWRKLMRWRQTPDVLQVQR